MPSTTLKHGLLDGDLQESSAPFKPSNGSLIVLELAIDGSHICIKTPSNIIVAANHHNYNKSLFNFATMVVDSNCYFI